MILSEKTFTLPILKISKTFEYLEIFDHLSKSLNHRLSWRFSLNHLRIILTFIKRINFFLPYGENRQDPWRLGDYDH